MRRVDPLLFPEHLREIIADVNVLRARAKELLELLRELTDHGSRSNPTIEEESLGRLMDMHVACLLRYLRLSEESTERIMRDFDDDE